MHCAISAQHMSATRSARVSAEQSAQLAISPTQEPKRSQSKDLAVHDCVIYVPRKLADVLFRQEASIPSAGR
ncbi:protein of unknown function [Methylorubrum extorquens]|uniref:Uncharacterized protein n=1 Tax=Methylorubrum extorquens TaxID=408 RepID=A0A2N9AQI1_METEX|nr:protein of unknown function [Methylorubrum extorquens]